MRAAFTRDEWVDVVLRSVGLEPVKLNRRLKFHFIARLAPLVEANFNFIELGPRGTGKSYFFSEFSPYSTLISGGQATKSILFKTFVPTEKAYDPRVGTTMQFDMPWHVAAPGCASHLEQRFGLQRTLARIERV